MDAIKILALPIHLVDKSSTHELSQSIDGYATAILTLQHTDRQSCAQKVPDGSTCLSLSLLSLVDDLQDSFHDPSYQKHSTEDDDETQDEDKDTVKGRENFNKRLYCARMHMLNRDPASTPSATTMNSAASKIKDWSKGFRPARMSFKDLYISLNQFNKPDCDGGVISLDVDSAPSEMNSFFRSTFPESVGLKKKCVLKNQLDILLYLNPTLKMHVTNPTVAEETLTPASLEQMLTSAVQTVIGNLAVATNRDNRVVCPSKHAGFSFEKGSKTSGENTLEQQREVVARARHAADLAQQSLDALEELHALEASTNNNCDIMSFEDDHDDDNHGMISSAIRDKTVTRDCESSVQISDLHTLLAKVQAAKTSIDLSISSNNHVLIFNQVAQEAQEEQEAPVIKKQKTRSAFALHHAILPISSCTKTLRDKGIDTTRTKSTLKDGEKRRVYVPARFNT